MKDSTLQSEYGTVSIIMPVYNAAAYLPRSMSSVQNQTYHDWELLIVDDGSTDESIDIVKSYADKDSRIKLLCNQHGGTARARNTALDVAQGEYIAFLDADDAYHPIYLSSLMRAMYCSGAMVGLCRTVRGTDAKGFFESEKNPQFTKMSVHESLQNMYCGQWPDYIAPYTKIFDAKLFEGVRFPDGMYFEDAATMFLPVYYANFLAVTEESLYFYNITPNSSSVTKKSFELLDREKALRSHWEFYKKQGRYDLVILNMPFYLTELISIYSRIETSDKPSDCEIIRRQFEKVYKDYKKKIELDDKQKDLILAFRHPSMYDIRNMIRKDGVIKTGWGFVQRKLIKLKKFKERT